MTNCQQISSFNKHSEECFYTRNIIKIALFAKKMNWNNSSRVALKAKPIARDSENDSKKSM